MKKFNTDLIKARTRYESEIRKVKKAIALYIEFEFEISYQYSDSCFMVVFDAIDDDAAPYNIPLSDVLDFISSGKKLSYRDAMNLPIS